MKQTARSIVIGILALGFLLLPATDALAAKKRKIDSLKFPELNKFELPAIQKSETANGIRLRVINNDKLPLVTFQARIKGGSLYNPPSKVGLASITGQLLRIGGAGDLSGEELDKLLDSNGISISTYASNNYFFVSFSCLTENFDTAVSILAKILMQPAFNKDKLEEIKTQLASGIARRNEQPDAINGREFDKLIYGSDSPLAAVLEYEHLDNIGRNDVIQMYKAFFAPGNMLAGINGPIPMDKVKQTMEKYFGEWKQQVRPMQVPKMSGQKHDFKVGFTHKESLNQSYFSIGHMGIIDSKDPVENAKIKVFNSIFSSGFSSRLVNRLRTQMGLTYGVYGGIGSSYLWPSKTYFTSYTKCESTVDAIAAVLDEINKIRTQKITAKELQEAKDYFLNSYVFKFSTPSQILTKSLTQEAYGIPSDYEKQLVDNIKKVTADDVLEIAKKYLTPEKVVIYVVGNEKIINKGRKLSELGKVKNIDITIKPQALKEKIPPASPESLAKGQKLIDTLAKTTYKGYKKIKSLKTTSSMNMTMQGRNLTMGAVISRVFPDKLHLELSVMGMKIFQIMNGKKGKVNQMGNEQPIPETEIEKQAFGDLYDVFNAKDKYKFQYLKEEKINGNTYDVIYITDAKKNWVKFFINKKTQFIEIEEKLASGPGMSGITRMVSSQFKTVKGIPFSFKTESFAKGKVVRSTTVKEILVNPKIDLKLFNVEIKKK
jgi:zinc protease